VSLGFGILAGSVIVLLVVPAYASVAARIGDRLGRGGAPSGAGVSEPA
jgi:hypothetical protein